MLAKRHSQTEIQVRILCLTDDDVTKTLEFQEHFALVANSPYVEVNFIFLFPQYLYFEFV